MTLLAVGNHLYYPFLFLLVLIFEVHVLQRQLGRTSLQMHDQKLDVALVENLNFFLQLLHHVSVLVRGLKNWTVVLEGIQQCFQDIRFDHAFSKCYNFCNHWRRKGAQGPGTVRGRQVFG